MSVDRAEPAQHLPVSVERVRAKMPRVILEGTLFREHALRENVPDGGCWWFSGSGEGRLDLEEPMGTCYLGETAGVAVRERCGRLIAMGVPITEAMYQGRVVSEVTVPRRAAVADFTATASLAAGVTGELSAVPDYGLSQAWAKACASAGFDGLKYAPRFTPGGGEAAYALFGEAGARPEFGIVRRRALNEVLEGLGYPTVRSEELSEAVLDVEDASG